MDCISVADVTGKLDELMAAKSRGEKLIQARTAQRQDGFEATLRMIAQHQAAAVQFGDVARDAQAQTRAAALLAARRLPDGNKARTLSPVPSRRMPGPASRTRMMMSAPCSSTVMMARFAVTHGVGHEVVQAAPQRPRAAASPDWSMRPCSCTS